MIGFGYFKLQTAITSGSRKIEDLRAQAGEIQSQRDLIFQKLREAENKLMEVSKKLQEGRGREQMYNERLIHLRSTTAPLDKYQQCVRLCTELEKDLADFQIENKGLNTTVENLRHELRDVRLNSVSLKEYDECARKAESGHQTIRQLQQDLSENRAELERLASSCQSAKIAVIKAQTEIDHSRMNEQQLQHTIQSLESRNEKLNTENRQLHTRKEELENDKKDWRQKCRDTSKELTDAVQKNARLVQVGKWMKNQLTTIASQQSIKQTRKCTSRNCQQMSGHWVKLSPAQQRKIKKYLINVEL